MIKNRQVVHVFIDQISNQLLNYIHNNFNFRKIKLKKAFEQTAIRLNTTTAYVKRILNQTKLNSKNKEFNPKLILKDLHKQYNQSPKVFDFYKFVEKWTNLITGEYQITENQNVFVNDCDQNPPQINSQSFTETNQQNNIQFVTGFLANSDQTITVPEEIKPLELISSSDYLNALIDQPKQKTIESLAYNVWELAQKYNVNLPPQLSWDIAELKLKG